MTKRPAGAGRRPAPPSSSPVGPVEVFGVFLPTGKNAPKTSTRGQQCHNQHSLDHFQKKKKKKNWDHSSFYHFPATHSPLKISEILASPCRLQAALHCCWAEEATLVFGMSKKMHTHLLTQKNQFFCLASDLRSEKCYDLVVSWVVEPRFRMDQIRPFLAILRPSKWPKTRPKWPRGVNFE